MAEAISSGATKRTIANDFPTQYIKFHKGIEKLIDILAIKHEPCEKTGPWPWDLNITVGTHIIFGSPGTGKTEYVKSILPKALFISHLDKLSLYDPEVYQGIIFDDMCFLHLPREAQIHLVDQDNARDVHVRYTTAHIPRATVKIFTTNVGGGRIFALEDQAIRRRVILHELISKCPDYPITYE